MAKEKSFVPFALFLLLCYVILCLGAPKTKPLSDIYNLKKSELDHPLSTKNTENGKWNSVFRPILGDTLSISNIILGPIRIAIIILIDIADKFIPQSKGSDTNSSYSGLQQFKNEIQGIVPERWIDYTHINIAGHLPVKEFMPLENVQYTLIKKKREGFQDRDKLEELVQKMSYFRTKWCGAGNIASNSDDLGVDSKIDSCCRTHDMCPLNIPARSRKYGLKNGGLFTRSSCDCDAEFYNCLKNKKDKHADQLGVTYFNTLGPQCFEKVDCSEPGRKCRRRQKKGTQYQWSDNPKY